MKALDWLNVILYVLTALFFCVAALTDRPLYAITFGILMVVMQLQSIGEMLEKQFEDKE